MWIARDKDGSLFVYNKKPKKKKSIWMPPFPNFGLACLRVCGNDSDKFLEVSWEDSEPRELVLKPINE